LKEINKRKCFTIFWKYKSGIFLLPLHSLFQILLISHSGDKCSKFPLSALNYQCYMTRLLDLGIDHIRNIIMDMAKLSENSVFTAIESYEKGVDVKGQI
jgi:hypothetical protein